MHQRCEDCGSAMGRCILEEPEFREQQRVAYRARVEGIVLGHNEKHASSSACLVDDLMGLYGSN